MSWFAELVGEFGRSAGIDSLRPGDDGAVQFAFANGDVLFFEEGRDELLVYLLREIPAHEPEIKLRALALCSPERQWPWPVQAGLRGADRLLFLLRLPRREASLSSLERALDTLLRLHQATRAR